MKTDALDPDLTRQVLATFLGGLSMRAVSRKLGIKEALVIEVVRAELTEIFRAEEARTYDRITIRLTARQHTPIFTYHDCPLAIPQTTFHLVPDQATQLFGWLNDEIADEADVLRRKAIENLIYKMHAEEKRALARTNWMGGL